MTDLRLGRFTATLPFVHSGTRNSDHRVLRAVFTGNVRPGDVLVDMGCGRGRVLSHWLQHHPGHPVFGIELDTALAASTAARFAKFDGCQIIQGDAVSRLPSDATLLFLFNPFDRETVDRLRVELESRPMTDPPTRLLYSNPVHVEVFADSDVWSIEQRELGGGSVVPFHAVAVIDRIISAQSDAHGRSER